MTREQCEHCKHNSYGRDVRCYADRQSGRPLSEILYCWAATPCEALPGRLLKPIKRKKTNGNKPNH